MEEYSDTLTMTAWSVDDLKIIKDALRFSKQKMNEFTVHNNSTLSELMPQDFSEEIRSKIKWRISKIDDMIEKITEIIESAVKRKISQNYTIEDFQAFQKFGVWVMLLKEQIYSNKRRVYYHGKIKGFDSTKRAFYEFYLTPRLEYAFPYAGRNGIITAYTFNKQVNIFNSFSSLDESILRRLFQLKYPKYLGLIDDFKTRDWAGLVGESERDKILFDLQKLNYYDGYFNYELDQETYDFFHKEGLYKYSQKQVKSPAIGIFKMSCLEKRGEFPIEEMVDLDYERKYIKDKSIQYLLKDKNYSDKDFLDKYKNLTYGISEQEILDIFNSISANDLEEEQSKLNENFGYYKRRLGIE